MESIRFRGRTVDTITRVIRNVDAFPKVEAQLQEEKKISGGASKFSKFHCLI